MTDAEMLACTLSRWTGGARACRWCDRTLTYPRRKWCSDSCENEWRDNHVWPFARAARRAYDAGCVDCHAEPPPPRRGLLEVDHRTPCLGNRKQGCQHHQENLRTRCQFHHATRHRAAA